MVEILSGPTAARSVAQIAPSPQSAGSNPESVATTPSIPTDFYLSPVIRFDSEALKVIFELRDSRSGEVTRQFPPERAVRELEKTAGLGLEAPDVRQSGTEPANGNDNPGVQGASGPDSGEEVEQEVNVLI